MLASYGDFIPAGIDQRTLPEPGSGGFVGTGARYSDLQLYALTQFLYSLEPPRSPHPFDEAAARGQEVFRREGCERCHTPPLYTNNKIIPAPGFEPPASHRRRYDVLDTWIGTDPTLTTKTRRGTGYYKVPSLSGVWYRGPFEHNGSIAELEDWFDQARLEPDYVPSAWRRPGARPRPVEGHPFGLALGADDKKALVAFLRTL